MRELVYDEVEVVSGGSGVADAALKYCVGMPDTAKVTVTVTANGSLGVGATSTASGTTFTVETTCGDLRKEAEKQGGSKSGGDKKSSFMGYDEEAFGFGFGSRTNNSGALVLMGDFSG